MNYLLIKHEIRKAAGIPPELRWVLRQAAKAGASPRKQADPHLRDLFNLSYLDQNPLNLDPAVAVRVKAYLQGRAAATYKARGKEAKAAEKSANKLFYGKTKKQIKKPVYDELKEHITAQEKTARKMKRLTGIYRWGGQRTRQAGRNYEAVINEAENVAQGAKRNYVPFQRPFTRVPEQRRYGHPSEYI